MGNSKMVKEIYESPQVIAATIHEEFAKVQGLAGELGKRKIDLIIIAARGTSDNAAQYAKYLFEYVNGIPVSLAAPSLYTLYNRQVKVSNALVIGISQSGESPDVVEVLKSSRESGALTIAVTNNPSSPLSKAAATTILCQAGQEQSVAATKTYMTQLTALALLSFVWAGRDDLVELLKATPERINKVLGMETLIQEVVPRYRYMEECALIGRGFNFSTALEVALKFKETSYVGAQAYSSADFLHGPVAMVDEGFPVFMIAPPGETLSAMVELNDMLMGRKAETITLSASAELLKASSVSLHVPIWTDEILSPLVYAVPMQLFAYHLARTKGLDPDLPRGLNKVTLTR